MRVSCEYCDNVDLYGDRYICCITHEEVYEKEECENYNIESYIKYCKESEKIE